jgi:predicted metal-dependent phosphoesterase TrpH
MKFELHCHSVYSRGGKIPWEGLSRPEEIAGVLKRRGFGGLAVTDHNTTAGLRSAGAACRKSQMVFIPGMEISTRAGHVIALGIDGFVKGGRSVIETVEDIRALGGISVAPHPYDAKGEGIAGHCRYTDAVEVFNSLNLTRIGNWRAKREAQKIGKPQVCGSDAHSREMLGMAANLMSAHDADSAIEEIRRGRVAIDCRYIPVPVVVDWARKRMELSRREIIDYVNNNYSRPKAGISKIMLRAFLNHPGRAWDALGYFAIGASTVYGISRILK